MKFLLVGINSKYIHTNLALYYLDAYAKKYLDSEISIKSEISEWTINQPVDKVAREIVNMKPSVLGFSCYIWNIDYILKLIEIISKAIPNVDIWLGGPEVSFDCDKFLDEHKNIKGIMVGEGEETYKELLEKYYNQYQNIITPIPNNKNTPKNLKQNIDLTDIDDSILLSIKSLVFRDSKNKIISTSTRECLNLSDVPFPYNDLSKFENRIIYYESSRGCPFSCKYCLSSVDNKIRIRDIKIVQEELQFFLDNNVKQVKFIDRTFNARKDHATSILKYILEHDNGITNFHFEVAADLLTEEMINLISQMRPGLIQLEIGVQTTNEITTQEISRKTDISLNFDNVKKIKSFNNTHIHLDLIAGLPFENYESFKHSFDDVYRIKPDQLQLGFLKVLKGSLMSKESMNYEIVYSDNPPYEVIKTNWISYEELSRLKDIEEIVETYYNSGQFINSLKRLELEYDSPFEMYEEIASFFKSKNYFDLTPNRETKYIRLLEFCIYKNFDDLSYDDCISIIKNEDSIRTYVRDNKRYLECDFEIKVRNIKIMADILTLDFYLREKAKKHPSFSTNSYQYSKDRSRIELLFEYDIEKLLSDNILDSTYSKCTIDYSSQKSYNNNYNYLLS